MWGLPFLSGFLRPRKRAAAPKKPEPCEHRFVRAVVGEDFARCVKCNAVTEVSVVWGGSRAPPPVFGQRSPLLRRRCCNSIANGPHVTPCTMGLALPEPRRQPQGRETTITHTSEAGTYRHEPVTMDEIEDAPPEVMRAFPEHFTYREMTFSEFASRKGVPNDPPNDVLLRLLQTAKHMQRVRAALRELPIRVTSGYRSPSVNLGVGGSKNSAHSLGYAVDFQCSAFGSPLKVAHALSMLDLMGDVDQLIHEHGAWVHISFDPRKRGMLLTIDRIGTREGLLPCR